MNSELSIDRATIRLREAKQAALRILSGAQVLRRCDGMIEITNCGATSVIDATIYDQYVQPLVQHGRQAFATPQGYGILDSEAILRCSDFLDAAIYKTLNEKRITAYFLQNGTSGCAFWRCLEPARILNETYPDEILAEASSELNYEAMRAYDIVVVQRGLFGAGNYGDGNDICPIVQSVVNKLKQGGTKIVYEIDDDLDGMPTGNAARFVYTASQRRFVSWLRDISDAIFVSNDYLAQKLGFPEKTFVLPNAIDINKFTIPKREESSFLFVLWHGGETHDVDINWTAKTLADFITNKKAKLEEKIGKTIVLGFMGYIPKFLDPYMSMGVLARAEKYTEADLRRAPELYLNGDPSMKIRAAEFIVKGRENIRYIKGVDVHLFHDTLITLQPDICICPLDPNLEFNLSKSPIKYIESTVAGAACVLTDTGPFSSIPDDCAVKARTPEQFSRGLYDLIYDSEKRAKYLTAADQYVKTNFDLRSNVHQWADALRKIVDVPTAHEEALAMRG